MKTPISFSKDIKLQNILFDEYFAEHQTIEVVSFNYDATGSALCQCNGAFAEIKKANLRRIIFGAEKLALETYLLAIFDPDTETDEIQRQNGEPIFRLAELNTMKKYDIANLAKDTLKAIQSQSMAHFRYFAHTGNPARKASPQGQ